jgi:type VI secretion system secreted protein Hcp
MTVNRAIVVVVFGVLAICSPVQAQTGTARPAMQFQAGGSAACRVAIRGQKQGQFIGQSRPDKWIPCSQFLLSLTVPRDQATGQPSGRRQYSPVVVTKGWDAASPQILTAAATNEVLVLVEFEFTKPTPDGREFVFETVKLTNATISAAKQYIGFPDAGEPPNPRDLEDVSFTFQKIEVTNTEGRTTFVDDWSR